MASGMCHSCGGCGGGAVQVLSVILSTNGWNIFFQEQTINGPDAPSPFDTYIACLRCALPHFSLLRWLPAQPLPPCSSFF